MQVWFSLSPLLIWINSFELDSLLTTCEGHRARRIFRANTDHKINFASLSPPRALTITQWLQLSLLLCSYRCYYCSHLANISGSHPSPSPARPSRRWGGRGATPRNAEKSMEWSTGSFGAHSASGRRPAPGSGKAPKLSTSSSLKSPSDGTS